MLLRFRASNLNGRATLTWEQGKFIVSREYYAHKVSLYAMPGFYSEVWYDPKSNIVDRIEPVTDAAGLEKYLYLINLNLGNLED